MSLELDRDPGWWRSRALGMLEEAFDRLRREYLDDPLVLGGAERAQRFDTVTRFLAGSAGGDADHTDTAHALGLSLEDVHELVCQLRKRLGTLLHHDIQGTADADDDVAMVRRALCQALELPPDPTLVKSATLRCKKGHALHADAPHGLCPRCLFELEALARLPRNARIAAVLGPRDRDRHEARLPLPSDIHVIVHPGLDHGHARRLHQPSPAALRAGLGIAESSDENSPGDPGRLRYAAPYRVDDYRDPVAGFEGAWSAVFAAADASGYIVAVQSRRDVTPLAQLVARKLAIPAYLFGVTLFALIAVALTHRRRA